MKKQTSLIILTVLSLGMFGCGGNSSTSSSAPESSAKESSAAPASSVTPASSDHGSSVIPESSSGKEKKTIDQNAWDNAFSKDLLDNVTIDSEMIATVINENNIRSVNTIVQENLLDDGKLYSEAEELSEIFIDSATVVGMDEEDLEWQDYLLQDDGYVAETVGTLTTYTLDELSGGYAAEKDTLTHYEYYMAESDVRYSKITGLYSFGTMIENNLYSFVDFAFPFSYATYDAAKDQYDISSEYLNAYYSEVYDLTITGAYMNVTFDDDALISQLKIGLTVDSETMDYTFRFSDYGSTSVTLPTDFYECTHEDYDKYQEFSDEYHYNVCEGCDSVMDVEAHTFDADGCCTICQAQPSEYGYIDFNTSGAKTYESHVILTVSSVTGNPIGIYISDMDEDWDFDDDGNMFYTYTCENCPLSITYTYSYEKDENCLVTETYTYAFYGEDGSKLMDDLVFVSAYYDHWYEYEDEAAGNCKITRTYICLDCGDTYSYDYYEHHFETTSYDEYNQTGTVKCLDCEKTYTADYLFNTDYDDREHEMSIIYTEDGQKYSQYYYETHTADEDGWCEWCGTYVTVLPYEDSKCSEAVYDYHIYLQVDEDNENVLLDYYFDDFEDIEEEIDSELEPDVYERGLMYCDECGIEVEYETTFTGTCTRDYTRTYKIYKDDVLLGTYYWYETVFEGHSWGEPEYTYDGCQVTTTYTCTECGEVETYTDIEHDWVDTCTVDADGTHHVHSECSKCNEYYDEDYDDHSYQNYGTPDHDNHCISTQKLTCAYCGEVAATTFEVDWRSHDHIDGEVVAENTEFGQLYVVSCQDCGDFLSYYFTADVPDDDYVSVDNEDGSVTEIYGDQIEITKSSETSAYNGNECIQVTYSTITITYQDVIVYTNTYISSAYVEHTDECLATDPVKVGTYGWYTVYQYSCGYISIE